MIVRVMEIEERIRVWVAEMREKEEGERERNSVRKETHNNTDMKI